EDAVARTHDGDIAVSPHGTQIRLGPSATHHARRPQVVLSEDEQPGGASARPVSTFFRRRDETKDVDREQLNPAVSADLIVWEALRFGPVPIGVYDRARAVRPSWVTSRRARASRP